MFVCLNYYRLRFCSNSFNEVPVKKRDVQEQKGWAFASTYQLFLLIYSLNLVSPTQNSFQELPLTNGCNTRVYSLHGGELVQ